MKKIKSQIINRDDWRFLKIDNENESNSSLEAKLKLITLIKKYNKNFRKENK